MEPLETLEQGLRHLLERFGERVDSLLNGSNKKPSLRSTISNLLLSVQRAIDKNLEESNNTFNAPEIIHIMLDYDSYSQFSQSEIRILKDELKTAANQYISDRRYNLKEPLKLDITYSPLVKSTTVHTSFNDNRKPAKPSMEQPQIERNDRRIDKAASKRVDNNYTLKTVSGPIKFFLQLKDLTDNGSLITIGRSTDNSLVLNDASVSKFHASLAVDPDGRVILADCGSTNGTFLNGEPVENRREITTGDIISFGDIEIRLDKNQ